MSEPWGNYNLSKPGVTADNMIEELFEIPCQYTIPHNIMGTPAMSLPLAMHSTGVPIGVQIAAKPAGRAPAAAAGRALEQAMPWRTACRRCTSRRCECGNLSGREGLPLGRHRRRLAYELPQRLERRRNDKTGDLGAFGKHAVESMLGGIDLHRGVGLHGPQIRGANEFHQRNIHDLLPVTTRLEFAGRRRRHDHVAAVFARLIQAQQQRERSEAGDNGHPARDLRRYQLQDLRDQLHVEAVW